MANTNSENTTRPTVLDTITESQLSELENQYDENDRDQFNTIVESFGWDTDTGQDVWDWLSVGERLEGFEGSER